MKLRHILMIIILVIVLSIFIETKGVEHLTCIATGTLYESPSVSTLEISIKNDILKDINISVDIKLNDELKKQKTEIKNMIAMEGKAEVEETKEGLRLKSGMNGSYFSNLGLTKDITSKELKEVLELQGFSCK